MAETEMLSYTRSIRRRLLAVVVDVFLWSVLCVALTYPIANSLDSPMQSGLGFFHATSCIDGKAFNTDGHALSMEGWQRIVICDQTVDFLFPYREARFLRQRQIPSVFGEVTYTETVAIPLDGQHRAAAQFSLTYFLWLAFVIGAMTAEHFWGRTPGKHLLGLKVEAVNGGLPTAGQSIIRNLSKYNYVLLPTLLLIPFQPLTANAWLSSVIAADNKVVLPQTWSLTLWATVAASSLCLVGFAVVNLPICLPWRTAGRALYDRLAGTCVRTATQ